MSERYDAIMPHGLGWKDSAKEEKKKLKEAQKITSSVTIYDISRPSELGQFVVDAVLALHKNDAVKNNIVVTGGRLFKHTVPYARLLTDAIHRSTHDAHVVDAGKARTTSSEIRKLAKEAKKHNWKNVSTMTIGIHQERAALIAKKIFRKRNMRKKGITIAVLKAEDILLNSEMHGAGGDKRAVAYSKQFQKLQESGEYKALTKHEERAIYIERLHLTRIADVGARFFRPKVMSK